MAGLGKLLLSAAVAAAAVGAAQAAVCPSYVRAVNSFNASTAGVHRVDIYANDEKIHSNVDFRVVTQYLQMPPGRVTVGIRHAGAPASSPFLASANFIVAAGKYYTAGFLGSVAGPAGQLVYNTPPIVVNEDVRNVPNPGRFNGLWYRWSETNLVIDFRTVAGDPAPPTAVTNAADAERITALAPKTVIPIAELPVGTYSFYPVGVGSNAPLANPRLTSTGGYVTVRGLATVAGTVYDFFATGDSLLNPHAYNLEVSYTATPLSFDAATGCTVIPGRADYGLAASTDEHATLDRINGVTIATLILAALALPFAIASAVIACGVRKAAAQKPLKSVAGPGAV